MKKRIIRYSVTMGVGLAFALIVSFCQKLYWQTDTATIMRILCDCFVVPGILFILFGLLIICSNGGTFDMLGYGCKKALNIFQSSAKRKANNESFYDYRKRKQENKRSFAYFFICGAIYMALGIVFLILYYYL